MGIEGTTKVIEDARRKKQEKNRENVYSISIVRVGNAAGNSGPLIFHADGKKLESKALNNLDRKGHLSGSTVNYGTK